jgi:hypothetical protein
MGDRYDKRLASPTNGLDISPEVHFPGWQGVPYRGVPGMFREGDPQAIQPRQGVETFVDIFDLSKPEDKEEYDRVIQVIANGHGVLSKEDLRYDEQLKNWRVFIRWGLYFAYNPQETKAHGSVRKAGGNGAEQLAGPVGGAGDETSFPHPFLQGRSAP